MSIAAKFFNEDQLDHMRYLAAIDPARKCWCGWYLLDQCPHCPRDVSSLDKLSIRCPGCENDSGPYYSRPITHRIGCERSRDALAIELGLIELGGEA